MNKNEIATINLTDVKEKLELQIVEKGLSNMVYTMTKSKKTLVSYNKATLEQLTMDLGLRKVYKDKSLATSKGVLFVVELELIDSENRMWATSVGYANTEESSHFSTGGGEQDTLRLGAIAQKRALGFALTPILVRLGLDYQSVSNGKQVEITSNVDDMIKQDKALEDDRVDNKVAMQIYKYCLANELVYKTVRDILISSGIANVQSKEDLTLIHCKRITKEQYELIKQATKGNK